MLLWIATDAWSPQSNGVVTTIRNTVRELERLGHAVGLVTADGFRTALAALELDRDDVRRHAITFSWAAATQQFLNQLHPFEGRGLLPRMA